MIEFRITVLIFLILIGSACNDDNNPSEGNILLGNWELVPDDFSNYSEDDYLEMYFGNDHFTTVDWLGVDNPKLYWFSRDSIFLNGNEFYFRIVNQLDSDSITIEYYSGDRFKLIRLDSDRNMFKYLTYPSYEHDSILLNMLERSKQRFHAD